MNNLDPAVAESPAELVVYGGIGRAARDWESFDRIVATLKRLEADQTLLIQSGKPVGVFTTHADAPRVLLANCNLVPRWSTWEHFNELDRKGLMMYGQMTAGSWIYIGSQGIVQGTYETFVEMGRQHFGGSLAGRWLLTAGLGGMGGAQPLASVMAGASCLAIECQRSRIDMRLESGYLDHATDKRGRGARAHRTVDCTTGSRFRWGCSATPPKCCLRCSARHASRHADRPDQRPRPGQRLSTAGLERREVARVAHQRPRRHCRGREGLDGRTRTGDARFPESRRTHRRLRQQHPPGRARGRREERLRFPGFVPAYIRPLFCRGVGSVPLGRVVGRPGRHREDRAKVKELLPDDSICITGSTWPERRIKFQGLPARICWVGLGDRHRLGLAFNEMVASGELKAPVVIGRDHLDPVRWPLPIARRKRCAMVRRRVGLAVAQRAAQHCVGRDLGVDPSRRRCGHGVLAARGRGHRLRRDRAAAKRIARVLWNDPASGVMRHADAGYDIALTAAREQGLDLPGILPTPPPAAALTPR